jgi:hypothetical protein
MKKTPPGNASEPIGNAGTGDSMSAMMSEMHEGTEAPAPGSVDLSPMPPPVMLSKPNAYGIRGLEERIGEWALWGKEASTDGQEGERQYVILRGVSGGRSKGTVSPSGVTRQPWEAFGDVSFRCVLSSTDVQR